MGYTTPRWVRLWLSFSTVVVLWDAAYCFARPHSFPGGDLSWIWAPYNMVPYSDVDLIYGWKAFKEQDGFTNAQSLLNVFEAGLNVLTVYLGDSPAAPVFAFAVCLLTASKTILYFLQEYFCGWCNTAQNDRFTFWTVWVATNGTWILIPTIASLTLGAGLIKALTPPKSAATTSALAVHKPAAAKEHPAVDPKAMYPTPIAGAPLPVTFHPRGRTALVVGSNHLVTSRVFTLLEADAVVILASDVDLSAQPEEVQWRVQQGQIHYEKFDGDEAAWKALLVERKVSLVCATDTLIGSKHTAPASQVAVYGAASDLCIPINVTDRPLLSTFTFPSVHRFPGIDGPSNLQVAVSTNGQGCRLAGRIRRDIAAKLPSSVGPAVDNVGMLRSRAKTRVSEDDLTTPLNKPVAPGNKDQFRRMRWVQQMSEYYSYDALASMGASEMDAALDSSTSGNDFSSTVLPHHDGKKGRILLVGSGPGHPSLLTVAARHALENATLILSDKLVPAEVIALIPKTTKLHIARKFPGNADGAQNELMDLALAGARAGETVVRLKQGDPFVYGRGGEEVLHFRANGFEPIVVPGVSSAIAGPLMLGIPVTQRGVADSLVMCTGVGRAGASVQLPGYVKSRTLAILMGVARIDAVLEVLTGENIGSTARDGAKYPRHLPVAIVERAGSHDQRVILSTLEGISGAIASVDQRPPGMILVGWAAMCLEGAGRVDLLDSEGEAAEKEAVAGWLDGKAWKTREGLPQDWSWFGSF